MKKMSARKRLVYGGPSLPIKKNENNKNQIKMKIKNWNNEKIYYSEKKPTKLSWPMSTKSDKKHFLFKNKKSTKLPWPMSAKSDT